MPRYAWDGALDDGLLGETSPLRSRSCEAAVLGSQSEFQSTTSPHVGTCISPPAADQSPHLVQPCPSPSLSAASGRSLLLSDPERQPLTPQRVTLAAPLNGSSPGGLGQARSPPPLPAFTGTPPGSIVASLGTFSSPGADVGTVGRRSLGGLGEAASGVVANTVGLVSELQTSTKCLLKELEQRDSEVRVLRRALTDLAREAGSVKPSVRNLLGTMREEELDSHEQAQLHSLKRSHRERQLRHRRSAGGTSCCDCEHRVVELRAELDQSKAKLIEAEAKEKKLTEDVRRISWRERKNRSVHLELERCRMSLEDGLSRQLQVPPCSKGAGATHPLLRSASRGSECSARGKRPAASSVSPRTPQMPSRFSTCSSSGAPTPPEEALQQAEALVLQMFDLPGARSGSRSPGAGSRGSRSPAFRQRSSFSRSPQNASRADTAPTGILPAAAIAAATRHSPASARRSLSEELALLPPPLPKAHSDPVTATSTAAIRPINGSMPRFPSAELGSPKPANRAARESDPTRRRSCPLLTESCTPHVERARASEQRSPVVIGTIGSTLETPSASSTASKARQTRGSGTNVSTPEFEFSLAGDFGMKCRADETTPIAPSAASEGHWDAVQVARIVASRMSGSPQGSPWPADSPKAAEAVTNQDVSLSPPLERSAPIPARFAPVNVPATRLGGCSGSASLATRNQRAAKLGSGL